MRLLLSRFGRVARSGRLAAPTQRDEYCRAAEPLAVGQQRRPAQRPQMGEISGSWFGVDLGSANDCAGLWLAGLERESGEGRGTADVRLFRSAGRGGSWFAEVGNRFPARGLRERASYQVVRSEPGLGSAGKNTAEESTALSSARH